MCRDTGFLAISGHEFPETLIDRWVSTVHRVTCESSRWKSIAFSHLPNWDAETIRHFYRDELGSHLVE